MNPPVHWALDLHSKLPTRTWAWVIVALSQDPLLWSNLTNPDLYNPALKILQENPRKLTPARLGLLSANTNLEVDSLQGVPVSDLPKKIRYQIERFDPFTDGLAEPSNNSLKKALFSAYKINVGMKTPDMGTWLEGKFLHLLQNSRLVLACLLELVSDPTGLLQYILARTSIPGEFDTILQAFFSLPQDPEEQLRSLRLIIQGLPDQIKIDFIRSLARQRPGQAAQLTREVKSSLVSDSLMPEETLFKNLITKKLELDLNQLSNLPEDILTSIEEAIELSKKVQGHLSARLAQQLASTPSLSGDSNQKRILEAWKNAIRANPKEPFYLAGILKLLIKNSRLDEAKAWLDSFRGDPTHPLIVLQLAKILFLEANRNGAIAHALAAQAGQNQVPQEYRADFLLDLSTLLESLGYPQEALQALEMIIASYPMDADYLGLLSRIQGKAEVTEKAFDSAILAYAASLVSERDTSKSFSCDDNQLIFIEALEAEEEWSHAFKVRSTWMDKNPDPSGHELAAYAKSALFTGQTGISLNLLNRAINLGNEDAEICELLGLTYQKLGNFSKAIEYFEKSCHLAPHQHSTWLHLAEAHSIKGDPERTIETLRTGALAVPDSAEILLKLGQCSTQNHAPSQAIVPLQKAANLVGLDGSDPQSKTITAKKKGDDLLVSEIACTLADVLRSVGKVNDGRHVLEKSLQQVDGGIQELPALFSAYAEFLKESGDYEHAIPLLERLIEGSPENLEYHLSLSQSLLSVPDQPAGALQALPLLSTILEKTEDPNQVYLAETFLAEAFYKVGNLEASKSYYQKSLKSPRAKTPNWHQKITFGLGKVNFALNEVEAALAAFQEAIRSNSSNAEINRWLAESYMAVHLYEESITVAQQVIHQSPGNEEILLWFTDFARRIQTQSGLKQENAIQDAIRLLLRTIQNGAEKPALWLRLGELHLLDRDVLAAFAAFGRILDSPASTRQELFKKLSHLFTAGKLLIDQRAYEESIAFLEPAALLSVELNVDQIDSEPFDASDIQPIDILNQLEEAYLATDNLTPSVEILRKIINLDPRNPGPYIRLAERLYSLGLVQEAISCLETATDLQPANLDLYNNIIWIYSLSGDLVSALSVAEKASQKAELKQDHAKANLYRYLSAEIARSIFATDIAKNFLENKINSPSNDLELKYRHPQSRAQS